MLDFRIGLFMGLRQIQRTNPWATVLIVIVILFTFLNLIAVSGILIGIVDGAKRESREAAFGDILIKPLDTESEILEPDKFFQKIASLPQIQAFSPRYTGLATIEANYKERRDLSIERDIIAITITGIEPSMEDNTVRLASLVTEGQYFSTGESGYILIGKHHVKKYAKEFGDIYPSINVKPGDTVRVTIGEKSEEFKVKGIVDSKIDFVSLSVFIPEKEFRRLFNKVDIKPNQIIAKVNPAYNEDEAKAALLRNGLNKLAIIETFTESSPKYVNDVATTFSILGIFVGIIGIAVASITIFIVIFINALSRKRQIGILKAIGISERAIEYAYITQASLYTLIGSTLGVLITIYALIPYFINNPIDFPYADVSLSISPEGMLYRFFALLLMTLIAGFIPAWLIVRQNTINSILGRK